MAKTVYDVLTEAADRFANLPALRVKRSGRWQMTTWKQYWEQSRQVAKSLIKLGLEPGQGVSIIGFNRPEWVLTDLGAILAGGVPAGIYSTCSPEQCQYIAHHCEAAVVVVEDAPQLAKFLEIREQLPSLSAIVMMDGQAEDDSVYTWEQFVTLGDEIADDDLDARIDAQKPDDLCTLIYTSGTTGPPKAVMLSHENVTWTSEMLASLVPDACPDDSIVSYLPLSHIAEQIASFHSTMVYGGCTWFAQSLETLGDTLREVHPTIFLGVPRVWEKIQARIVAVAAQNSGLKKKIGAWARSVGLRGGYAEQAGQAKPLSYPLANKLVFTKVREALGLERCRYAVSSAAPISRDTLEFFLSLGIPICEIYGMSECTGPATVSVPGRYQTGKAGFIVPGGEIKVADDGEICMRGPHVFLGYYKDEAATREALDDEGWLHSGDIGTLDSDGFVQITDRKKELIITAGGKNIAPQLIEGHLKAIPVINQAVVVGDGQKYLAALFTLDPERLEIEVASAGLDIADTEAATESSAFNAIVQKQVDAVNTKLSRVESIKRFVILPQELTIEGGELTPTMKLKRRVVAEKYRAEIESLYS